MGSAAQTSFDRTPCRCRLSPTVRCWCGWRLSAWVSGIRSNARAATPRCSARRPSSRTCSDLRAPARSRRSVEASSDWWWVTLVYAVGFLNPRGGFYAEQVVIAEDLVSRVPDGLTAAEAGAWVALEPQRCAGSMTSCASSRGRRCWCSGPAAGSVISLCNSLAGWAGEFWPWRQATMASSWPAGSMPTRWSTDDATTCRRRRDGSLQGASMQRC